MHKRWIIATHFIEELNKDWKNKHKIKKGGKKAKKNMKIIKRLQKQARNKHGEISNKEKNIEREYVKNIKTKKFV